MSQLPTDSDGVWECFIVGGLFAVCLVAAGIWRRFSWTQHPPLGIVLLLSRTKPLEASALAAAFSRVTGTTFQVITPQGGRRVAPADVPEGDAVLGEPPSFLVKAQGDLFLVNNVAKPYILGRKGAGSGVDDVHLAEALKEHQAWLSVEILHPEAVSSSNYRVVGQAIAELLSTECLALFHPESRKLVAVVPSETLGKLRTSHPINAVFGVPLGLS